MNSISCLPYIKEQLNLSIDYVKKEFNAFEIDTDFICFVLKKAIFFKMLAIDEYDKEHSIILVSEFLYLIKYYCSCDYRAFSYELENHIFEASDELIESFQKFIKFLNIKE